MAEHQVIASVAPAPAAAAGIANDPFERAADYMANRVMRMPEMPFVQRKCAHCEEEERANRTPLTPFLQKKAVEGSAPLSIQRDGEGEAITEEHINPVTHAAGSQIWSGTVDRHSIVPARGATPRRDLGSIDGVRIEFDAANCVVNLPMRVQFVHPGAGNWPFCDEDTGTPPPAALPADRFNDIRQRFISLANDWFNGWYTVRLSDCLNGCPERDIPINASIVEDNASPTTTVIIANKRGRSCATPNTIVLHATEPGGGDLSDARIVHEIGHAVLGYDDEYPVSAGNTTPETVHTDDFSMAGESSAFRGWMLAQERHFNFVPAFLESIFPDCTATLNAHRRSGISINLPLVLGGSNFGGSSFHLSTGFEFAFPLDMQRHLQLTLGPRFGMLRGLEYPLRNALMGGVRAGLQYTTNLSSGGFRIGAFGEAGGGSFDALDRTAGSSSATGSFRAGYYSVGGSLGYSAEPARGFIPFIGAEASYNSLLGMSADELRRFGPVEWFNVGLAIGVQWR